MKRPDKDGDLSSRRINRRALLVGGLQVALAGGLVVRMREMQVDQAEEFRMLAEENRINVRLLPPARGLIFDRDGVPLAVNDPNYRVVIIREDAGNVEEVLHKLARVIPMAEDEIARIVQETKRRSSFVPVTVRDQLSWDDLSRVAVNAPALPGIHPEVGLSRGYPFGSDFAHVIGYVGPVSDYDLSKMENPDPLLQIPKFQIGKTGVEAKMELQLRGRAGNSQIEVNATGRVMRELARTEGTAGSNLQLTVDSGVQAFAEARLAGESAAAVVLDVTNGDIVAIASAPSFDPNKFVRGISGADYKALMTNKYRPLANKTVQGVYPPGSTFKMVTGLAALEAGVIRPEDTVYCPGYMTAGGRRFHCWKRGGHGHVNLHDSLKKSCDVYYYEVAQRAGIDRVSAMAQKLGLGQVFDIPMSAVAEGLTPTRAWKQERYGQSWQVGDTLNAAIGQGYILASPLQLAVMAARVASGTNVTPRLVRAIDGVPQEITPPLAPLDISAKNLAAVRGGMYAVSNSQGGTAYRSRIADPAMEMAGKTGTSQVRNITAAERARGVFRNEDLPWERRDHALFVCFAPYNAPRYAVAVVVEHGGGGSLAAAPIARDILLRTLRGPDLANYPSSERSRMEELFRAVPVRGSARGIGGGSDRA